MASSKMKIVLNRAAIGQILKGDKVQADLRRRAQAVAAAAGDGMVAEVTVGSTRARAAVVTETPAARVREGNDRALTRGFDAARGD